MPDKRPNPDEVLARVQQREAKERRGKLKIFFGYSAGVGKTYAMLQAAHRQRAEGVDVVVGYVEPHGRPETEGLLAGLEALPFRLVEYRGLRLREFDLDAALSRRPQLILVDELAHTNAEGLLHAKRWQDAEELLAAGINVYSTLNVQHIESLNDIVAQVTGVLVRETLPDAVLERADELELIDISPEDLLERLQEGKVYLPEHAQRALSHFFNTANLTALRELALRRTADQVNTQVQLERREHAIDRMLPTTERLLVCAGPSPTTGKVIRTAKRMATALHAEWIAVSVETAESQRMTPEWRQRLLQNLRLAEQLGADTVSLTGQDVAEEVVNYARGHNVTKIFIGKTEVRGWNRLLANSIVDRLLRLSREIDVYVIHGVEEPAITKAVRPESQFPWADYLRAGLIVAGCGVLAAAMSRLGLTEANLVMVFLLGVVACAVRYGRGPAVLASIASVLVFDFCFVPPYFSFAVSDTQYILTFAVMLAVAIGASALTIRIREQAESARQRARRTEALYRLSRQLAGITGVQFLVTMTGQQLARIFGGEVAIYLPDADGKLTPWAGQQTEIAHDEKSSAVAHWVFGHDRWAGAGTDTLPNAAALFVPLTASQSTVGVLAIRPPSIEAVLEPDGRHMLEACVSQAALAIERDQLALQAHDVMLQAETERLRSSLLSSVSHDLRTPLAAIAGASSSLLDSEPPGHSTRRELLQSIYDESDRLSRLVDNLLDMTRIEAGGVSVHKQWCPLEEVIGSALHRLARPLGDRPVQTHVPADLPLVPLDEVLIEQVFINLLDNAHKYSPADQPIEISARSEPKQLVVEVSDHGPGLPPGEEQRVFEKFYRGPGMARLGRGAGLGLAICRAIVEAHGGRVFAENRAGGGACFRFTLPLEGTPPDVPELAVRTAPAT